ncbi:MAG: septum formation protein [Paracoccaceae bacterium]|jgi:septum formation protein
MRLILGSASPRRRGILAQIGLVPDTILPPNIDENPLKGELPRVYCTRIARAKLMAIAAETDDVVLCADTTVALGRRILGKPQDADEAAQFLLALGGRRHQVITAIAVKRSDRIWVREVISQVKMKRLSDLELKSYLQSGEWQGKAGGYAIQGLAAAFIPWISGSFSGIAGLPIAETVTLLATAGFPVHGVKYLKDIS